MNYAIILMNIMIFNKLKISKKKEIIYVMVLDYKYLKNLTCKYYIIYIMIRIEKGSLPELLYEACFAIDSMG
jgi:hypothetical protein